MSLSTFEKNLLQLFVSTAKKYGITPQAPTVGQTYAATPSIAQTIYAKIVEDGNPFLQLINVLPRSEMKGDKVGMSLTGGVISRTDTSGAGERTPSHLINTDSKGYELFATEFDVALKYSQIDTWAKFVEFAAMYMSLVRQAIGNDMLRVGWLGVVAAANATAADYTQVNKGWLELIRTFNAGSQYLLGNAAAGFADSVTLGETNEAIGGFANLDLLAQSAREMLPIFHQDRDDLVLCVSSNIKSYQFSQYYKLWGNTPSEKEKLNAALTKSYDEMPMVVPPFFPANTILVTPLKNLSIYFQDSSIRRTQKDKPEKNEVQDFNSVNQGYVVEDEEMTALIQNITLK